MIIFMGIAIAVTMYIVEMYFNGIKKSNLRKYAKIILLNTASISRPKMLKSRLFFISRLFIIIFFVYE